MFKVQTETIRKPAVNISKCHVNSTSRCIVDNMHVDLCVVYSIKALHYIDMDKWMIANVVASHAFRSLRKSNRAVGANSPFPTFVNTLKISTRPSPILLNGEMNWNSFVMFDVQIFFFFFLGGATFHMKLFKKQNLQIS